MKINPPLLFLILSSSAYAGPFQNGSFEQNNYNGSTFVEVTELDVDIEETSNSDYTDISATGWDLGTAGLNFNDDSTDGVFAAALSLDDTISQIFDFEETGAHTLTFDVWVNREQKGDSSGAVDFNVSIIDYNDRNKILSEDSSKSYGRGFVSLSYEVDVKTAGSHSIAFKNTGIGKVGPQRLFVDNVKITSEAVPEPSSSLLILLGGACMLGRRKRQ